MERKIKVCVYVQKNTCTFQNFRLDICRLECGALRQELSQRHSDDSSAALKELAKLKDDVMKQAKQRWEEEHNRLLKKVIPLFVHCWCIQAEPVSCVD